jgi:hypothetical protein
VYALDINLRGKEQRRLKFEGRFNDIMQSNDHIESVKSFLVKEGSRALKISAESGFVLSYRVKYRRLLVFAVNLIYNATTGI